MSQNGLLEWEKFSFNQGKFLHNFKLLLLDNGNYMIDVQIMRVSDFVEAVFFIIPEEYFGNILYAQLETYDKVIDSVGREKFRIVNKVNNLI